MSTFTDLESQDGVRLTWNVIPDTKLDAAASVIPIAAVYTPLKPIPSPLLPYAPHRCRICRAVLNPFATVDFATKIWICPFCFQRNHFLPSYNVVSEANFPAELYREYTIEYEASSSDAPHTTPPVFLFVIDTSIIEEEIGFLKSALSQVIELLPEQVLVVLVTFGTFVQVHELGFQQMPKPYMFRGLKELNKEQILEQMGFFARKPRPAVGVVAGARDELSVESISRYWTSYREIPGLYRWTSVRRGALARHWVWRRGYWRSVFLVVGRGLWRFSVVRRQRGLALGVKEYFN